MKNIPSINREQVMEHTTFHFVGEASELGWSPGFWPNQVDTNLGNGNPLELKQVNDEMAMYSQIAGCVEVTVYND